LLNTGVPDQRSAGLGDQAAVSGDQRFPERRGWCTPRPPQEWLSQAMTVTTTNAVTDVTAGTMQELEQQAAALSADAVLA
jgi:hypothetical protein